MAVQRPRFRRGDVGVPRNHARVRRRGGGGDGGGFPRRHFERRRGWSKIRGWSGGRRHSGCGCVRGGRGSHAEALLVRLRGGRGRGGGGGVLSRSVPGPRGDGRRRRGGGVQSRGEEGGEGRDAVYASLRTQALDVRRRGILHQRARGGAAVHRRRARGDPQGDPTPRARLAGFLLRRDQSPGGDGGVTAAATTVRAPRRAGPRVRVQRTDRCAARLAAQREGRDLRPGVRRLRRIHRIRKRIRRRRWGQKNRAGVSTRQRGRQGGGQGRVRRRQEDRSARGEGTRFDVGKGRRRGRGRGRERRGKRGGGGRLEYFGAARGER